MNIPQTGPGNPKFRDAGLPGRFTVLSLPDASKPHRLAKRRFLSKDPPVIGDAIVSFHEIAGRHSQPG